MSFHWVHVVGYKRQETPVVLLWAACDESARYGKEAIFIDGCWLRVLWSDVLDKPVPKNYWLVVEINRTVIRWTKVPFDFSVREIPLKIPIWTPRPLWVGTCFPTWFGLPLIESLPS